MLEDTGAKHRVRPGFGKFWKLISVFSRTLKVLENQVFLSWAMESYGNLSCSCWKHVKIKQNLIKSNVSAVVTFQLPLICHNYCNHPIGMIDCSTSPLRQGRRETKHYHHESPPSRTHDVVETPAISGYWLSHTTIGFSHNRPICFPEHWVGTLATSTLCLTLPEINDIY